LSKPQATVLALYSYGMVLTRSCGLRSVASFLAVLLGKPEATLRQRLREFNYAAADKRGAQRQAIEVNSCFGWLLRWVLSWWAGEERRLALALDASSLRNVFTVLAVSVVYRGCAIPVAWVIVPATAKGAWKGHWLRLLAQLEGVMPPDWTVIVLADRGLYARWLYRRVVRLGWHPFFRLNPQGTFRPQAGQRFVPLASLVQLGQTWSGGGVCFKTPTARLRCTLLACWEEGDHDPWLIITDLPPTLADAAWYGMRSWIEAG
jgi:hypothetical protein